MHTLLIQLGIDVRLSPVQSEALSNALNERDALKGELATASSMNLDNDRHKYEARGFGCVEDLLLHFDAQARFISELREAMEDLMAFQAKNMTVWDNPPYDCCSALLKKEPMRNLALRDAENGACKGRMASQLEFLAKTLGIDLIGGKAAEKLAEAGFDCVGFLSITNEQLLAAGFGAGQSANILAEIDRVKAARIEDYKVLASVGINTLGRRASKSLLGEYPLDALLSGIAVEQISALSGFADAKAGYIVDGVDKNRELIAFLVGFFDNITPSKLVIAHDAPLVGKNVVFTGALSSGSRNEVERRAEELGAKVQSSVNKKTHYLVTGANVGASKTSKAASLGVTVITENEYLAMIA